MTRLALILFSAIVKMLKRRRIPRHTLYAYNPDWKPKETS